MKNHPFVALLAGILFGLGLVISGMANPTKIFGFLDITGQWDPSLVVVLITAVSCSFIGVRIALRRTRSDPSFECQLPSQQNITLSLILGSVIFGMGWGLTGICPGPALVGLGLSYWPALIIVPAMLAGLWVGGGIKRTS
ncbi:DUF6691 family protein [Neptunomonas phycophila]|uniref:DUF6691 family protein n=1 Tax=Neptunomonas phycophila TaxID=1572645 RepID=UPI001BE81BA1|nr:DUF6691 family protein [Neptunomonas phycophila]MBT3146938.1 YeeE/YedE family protein [Neptunomonas phycophila]